MGSFDEAGVDGPVSDGFCRALKIHLSEPGLNRDLPDACRAEIDHVEGIFDLLAHGDG